jgi:hypothetical protein
MEGKDQGAEESDQLMAKKAFFGRPTGEGDQMDKDKIHQDGAGNMKTEIEQVIAEDIQAAQVKIQGKGSQEQRPVTARLRVDPAAHPGLEKELGDLAQVFDVGVSHDHVDVVVVEGSLKRVGIGQESQQEEDEAEEKISSHTLFRSFVF